MLVRVTGKSSVGGVFPASGEAGRRSSNDSTIPSLSLSLSQPAVLGLILGQTLSMWK